LFAPMFDHLREELESILPASEVDALICRLEARDQVDRELSALNLGRLHYHEALDRVAVACAHIEEHIGEHPVLRRHPELAAIFDRAAEALAELYQAIGRLPGQDRDS